MRGKAGPLGVFSDAQPPPAVGLLRGEMVLRTFLPEFDWGLLVMVREFKMEPRGVTVAVCRTSLSLSLPSM